MMYEGCLDFSAALEVLKSGGKVSRIGWNGKGMFIYYVPSAYHEPKTDAGKHLAGEGGKVLYGGFIAMKTATGEVVPWLPGQADMLAEDWCVYLFGSEEKAVKGIVM